MQYRLAPIQGINRNILECKADMKNSGVAASLVLIETYWNVKTFFLETLSLARRY